MVQVAARFLVYKKQVPTFVCNVFKIMKLTGMKILLTGISNGAL